MDRMVGHLDGDKTEVLVREMTGEDHSDYVTADAEPNDGRSLVHMSQKDLM